MHGGLTAALVDETFGGLSVSVWRAGGFGLQVKHSDVRGCKNVRTQLLSAAPRIWRAVLIVYCWVKCCGGALGTLADL